MRLQETGGGSCQVASCRQTKGNVVLKRNDSSVSLIANDNEKEGAGVAIQQGNNE